MLRVFCAASVAALLAGCASIPQPTPQAAPIVKQAAKPVAKPVEAKPVPSETKPATFKARWYDRFMRHKPK